MDTELAVLASSGATVLVGRMVTDGWEETKLAVARLFGRHSSRPEDVADELEEARTELENAQRTGDEAAAADVEAEWRSRLRRLLASDPDAVTEFKQLLAELGTDQPSSSNSANGDVKLTANASGHGRIYQVGRGELHVGDA